jgi:hypothetical protein
MNKTIATESFRQKQLRLLDGRQDLMHHVYHINNLVHGERVADWLLRNGFKGENLANWLRSEFDNSVIKMAAHVVSKINNAHIKPIIMGEDYRGKRI